MQILEDNVAKVTYTYDGYHNVKTAVTEEGLTYSFAYDAYGNNTNVAISSGDGTAESPKTTISTSAEYTDNGNYLDFSTDALGKITKYGYNIDTGVSEWVQSGQGDGLREYKLFIWRVCGVAAWVFSCPLSPSTKTVILSADPRCTRGRQNRPLVPQIIR